MFRNDSNQLKHVGIDTTKRLNTRDWSIVSSSYAGCVDINLSACTGIFAFHIEKPDVPYLVVHNAPVHTFEINPKLAVEEVMNSKGLKKYPGNHERISLNEVLEIYLNRLKESHQNIELRLGVYLVSGNRFDITDLAIAQYFSSDEKYELLGAELNERVKVRFKPSESLIELILQYDNRRIVNKIGQRYPINLRV